MTVHSKVNPFDLVAAVRTAVSAITDSVATANLTMNEGIADKRTIQVYLSEFEGAQGSQTDRNTFGKASSAALRKRKYTVKIDIYSRPKSQLGEDISAAENDAYSVIGILEAQDDNPPFGLSGVHTFHWTGKAGVFTYTKVEYWGSQFTLEFMTH